MYQIQIKHKLPMLFAIAFLGLLPLQAQQKTSATTVPVHIKKLSESVSKEISP